MEKCKVKTKFVTLSLQLNKKYLILIPGSVRLYAFKP
jgi:hypothetical protein